MLFFTDKPEKIAPKIEAKLRKEFGANEPLFYETESEGHFRPNSIGQALGDVTNDLLSGTFFGGKTRTLYNFRFDVKQPRELETRVYIVKAADRVALGSLLYSAILNRKIDAPLELEDEKILFGKSKFKGDSEAARKLNANTDLIKRINRFVRTEYKTANEVIKAKRYLKIAPYENGSLLTISTLPRATWFGWMSSFDAPAFLEIANAVEAAL